MGMFDDVLNNVGEPFKGATKGFEYGTHEVIIAVIEPTQKKTTKDPAAEVIEIEVIDVNDEERTGKATLYFHTEGGAKMSLTKILGIMVHNVGEEKKDKVRELGRQLFADIDDPTKARDIAVKLMLEKFISKDKPYHAYFFANPTGKYKTTNFGDLWHYEYEDPEKDSKDPLAGGTPVSPEELAEDMPDLEDL